jgi:hypothetical protein
MQSIDSKWLRIKLQNGPTKEVGENGCHIHDVVRIVHDMLVSLQEELPCAENVEAIKHIFTAYCYLTDRKLRRLEEGTLGYDIP